MNKILLNITTLFLMIIFTCIGYFLLLMVGMDMVQSICIGFVLGIIVSTFLYLIMKRIGFRVLLLPTGGFALGLLIVFFAQLLFGSIGITFYILVSAFVMIIVTLCISTLALLSNAVCNRLFGFINH